MTIQFGPASLTGQGEPVVLSDFTMTFGGALDPAPPRDVPESYTLTGTAAVSIEDQAAWDAWVEEQQRQELVRLKRLAAIMGDQPWVYDLSDFDLPWSPVYRGSAETPIGWSCNTTGAYLDGPEYPGDDL